MMMLVKLYCHLYLSRCREILCVLHSKHTKELDKDTEKVTKSTHPLLFSATTPMPGPPLFSVPLHSHARSPFVLGYAAHSPRPGMRLFIGTSLKQVYAFFSVQHWEPSISFKQSFFNISSGLKRAGLRCVLFRILMTPVLQLRAIIWGRGETSSGAKSN